jgi:hypothetical protein
MGVAATTLKVLKFFYFMAIAKHVEEVFLACASAGTTRRRINVFAEAGRLAAAIVKGGAKGAAHNITQGMGKPEKNPASTPYASVQAAVNCLQGKDDRLCEEAAKRSQLRQQHDAAYCLVANSVAARFGKNADSKGAGSLFCGN